MTKAQRSPPIEDALSNRGDETAPRRHFDSLQQEVFLNLWRTYDRLRELEDELFGAFDLTAQQYNALRVLRAELPDAMPTLQLASRLVSRAADITRLINKLVDRKWIRRESLASDRRLVCVRITKSGMRLLERLDPLVVDCGARQLGHLNTSEMRQLLVLLKNARAPFEPEHGDW